MSTMTSDPLMAAVQDSALANVDVFSFDELDPHGMLVS